MSDAIADPSSSALKKDEADGRRGGFGSLGSIVYLLVLTWAAALATFPLNDNSFFTHLATGRLILERGSVPSSDPYTFTAQGEPWTVQSWLASVAYAGAERMASDMGLRGLVLVLFVAAMSVLWKLTTPAQSIVVRFLLLAGALLVVTDLWSVRPYMIGVIGVGLVWLAMEGAVRPWLLVPFMWVWVNTHGSWLLASALIVALVVGAACDRRAAGGTWTTTDVERGVAGFVLLGTALGAVSPLGPKVLWFPLTALTRSEVFTEIVEWRAPTYESVAERAYLLLVIVTVLLLVRRSSWRLTVPAVAFAAAGLYAQRNIVMATVVLVAACARAAPSFGSLTGRDRPRTGPAVAGMLAALAAGTALLAVSIPVASPHALGGYPARALAYTYGGLDGRMATEIPAGNLLAVLDGPIGKVFIDDRIDMFDSALFEEFLALQDGTPAWEKLLDEHQIDVLLWRRKAPLSSLVGLSPEWAVLFSDTTWMVACRRDACA